MTAKVAVSNSLRTSRQMSLLTVLGTGVVLLIAAAILVGGLVWRNLFAPPATGKRFDDSVDALVVPPKTPKPKLRPEVKRAVERGVKYLKERILNRGNEKLWYRTGNTRANWHVGAMALAGLTLLECGVSPEDKAVKKAAAEVRESAGSTYGTYPVSTCIWFLDKLHEVKAAMPGDRKHIRSLAARLLAYQRSNGLWGYHAGRWVFGGAGATLTPAQERQVLKKALNGFASLKTSEVHNANRSNSQFAALALWTARKYDVPAKFALKKLAENTRASQRTDGTWVYDPGPLMLQDSNTCAGLLFLAVAHGVEDKKDNLRADPVVKKGLKHLGSVIGKKLLPPDKIALAQGHARKWLAAEKKGESFTWPNDYNGHVGAYFGSRSVDDLYFLWSIERVAMIYDLPRIERKDWYTWGTAVILKHQESNGSWVETYAGVPDTCFALLFLMRANIVKDLTDKLRRLRDKVQIQRGQPAQPTAPQKKT